jgi:Acetyltransferase (GNAT) domain
MTRPYLLSTSDAEAWKAALPTDSCVMGGLEYVQIQEKYLDQTARLFVSECRDCRVSYPFFLRPVPSNSLLDANGQWDTATPEYTGPILICPDGREPEPAFLSDFALDHREFCRSQGIVSEFAHLNPWKARMDLLDPALVEVNREIVYVDLTWGEEAIWSRSLSSDTRRQTRQAFEAGVRVRRADSAEDVLAFHRLHHQTMSRHSAMERYFLPPDYFLAIFETMPKNAFFLLSEYQDRIVAGGLYFQDATDVYWHLSAVDMEFSKVRPVNAYHYESIKQAVRAGKKRLLCGGAFKPGDGVFRFKAGFSPLRVPFKIYKRIHNPEVYAALNAEWSRRHDGLPSESAYFPAYRAPHPHPVTPSTQGWENQREEWLQDSPSLPGVLRG